MHLSLKEVKKSFGHGVVFNGISFVLKNHTFAWLDEGSYGKSVLMDLISGVEGFKHGSINCSFNTDNIFYISEQFTSYEKSLTTWEYVYYKYNSTCFNLYKNRKDAVLKYTESGGYDYEVVVNKILKKLKRRSISPKDFVRDLNSYQLALLRIVPLFFIDYEPESYLLLLDRPEILMDGEIQGLYSEYFKKLHEMDNSVVLCSTYAISLVSDYINYVIEVHKDFPIKTYKVNYEQYKNKLYEDERKKQFAKRILDKKLNQLHGRAKEKIAKLEDKEISKQELRHGKISYNRTNRSFNKLTNQAKNLRNRAKRLLDDYESNYEEKEDTDILQKLKEALGEMQVQIIPYNRIYELDLNANYSNNIEFLENSKEATRETSKNKYDEQLSRQKNALNKNLTISFKMMYIEVTVLDFLTNKNKHLRVSAKKILSCNGFGKNFFRKNLSTLTFHENLYIVFLKPLVLENDCIFIEEYMFNLLSK